MEPNPAKLQADWEVFCQFIAIVLDDEYHPDFGTADLAQLQAKWKVKAEEHKKTIQFLNLQHGQDLQKVTTRLKKFQTENRVLKQIAKDLKSETNEKEQAAQDNTELVSKNVTLESTVKKLTLEITSLKSCQDELAKLKAGTVMSALAPEIQENDTSDKLEEAQKAIEELKKEIVDLKSNQTPQIDIEQVKEDIRQEAAEELQKLRDQIVADEENRKSISEQFENTKNDFAEHRRKAQRLIMEKEMNLDKYKQRLSEQEETKSPEEKSSEETISALKIRWEELERGQSREGVNLDYLKNITLKYMEFVEARNYKEARTLQSCICTVLQFSSDELNLVSKAKDTTGITGTIKGVFSGNQAPGSGISHNTYSTAEGRKRARLN